MLTRGANARLHRSTSKSGPLVRFSISRPLVLLSVVKHVNNTIKNQIHAKMTSPTALTIPNPLKHLKTCYLEYIMKRSTFIKINAIISTNFST